MKMIDLYFEWLPRKVARCVTLFFCFVLHLVLALPAYAQHSFELSETELKEIKATKPYFSRTFGRVQVDSPLRLDFLNEFRNGLRNTLYASEIFDGEGEGRLSVQATILQVTRTDNGGMPINYQVKVTYDLLDKNVKVGSWEISSQATSTNFIGHTRDAHALTLAIQRNLRAFFLNLKATYDTEHADEARAALVGLGGEYKSDSINLSALAGYLVMGTATVVKTAASAAGSTIKFLGSPEVVAAMNQSAQEHTRAMQDVQRDLTRYNEMQRQAPRQERPPQKSEPRQLQCPAGSSLARNPNAAPMTDGSGGFSCVKDEQNPTGQGQSARTQLANSRIAVASAVKESAATDQSDSSSAKAKKKEQKVAWGPIKLEAVAICRKSERSGKWGCNGPLDNQILFDEPTLESALARQHCAGGVWAAGGPVLDGKQWDAYRCGHGLGAGDYDIVKRYGMITARRSYICPLLGEDRCSTLYDGQDKR